jgi:dGTPase
LRARVLAEADLPRAEIDLLGPTGARRIDALVTDLVESSRAAGDIVQSEAVGAAMARLRDFMFDRVYLAPEARSEHARVHWTVRGLLEHYLARPEEVPAGRAGGDHVQAVVDYVAGMTDRYCIATYRRLALPEESRL